MNQKVRRLNRERDNIRKAFILLGAALLAICGVPAPASAAYTECPKGYYCLWVSTNYGGSHFASEFSIGDCNMFGTPFRVLDRKASSAFNNGTIANVRSFMVLGQWTGRSS